jgi:hypothetical protein
MMPVWMVTTIFLRIWLIGLMLVILLSLSDFVFRKPHRLGLLGKRLATGLVWPLAAVTPAGRQALFASARSTSAGRSLTLR